MVKDPDPSKLYTITYPGRLQEIAGGDPTTQNQYGAIRKSKFTRPFQKHVYFPSLSWPHEDIKQAMNRKENEPAKPCSCQWEIVF